MDKKYLAFINELKQNIVQSRYVAARLVNREQLLLYYQVGRNLSEKISAEKWGAQVIEQIANERCTFPLFVMLLAAMVFAKHYPFSGGW